MQYRTENACQQQYNYEILIDLVSNIGGQALCNEKLERWLKWIVFGLYLWNAAYGWDFYWFFFCKCIDCISSEYKCYVVNILALFAVNMCKRKSIHLSTTDYMQTIWMHLSSNSKTHQITQSFWLLLEYMLCHFYGLVLNSIDCQYLGGVLSCILKYNP